MPVFKVHVYQFIEETAVIEVEATDVAAAVTIAQGMLADSKVEDWQEGDTILKQGVDEVRDTDNETLWEAHMRDL